ncbi:PqqD family protein [Herbiconiux sp. P17]|uniref:PqqD family protein n=1 Tax=Herbiconiux wuyangfengii TaxID=3342794 RepID=UPI0035B9A21A
MSTEERWNRSPDVAVTVHGASTFVLDLASHSAQPVLLDGTAQDVWKLVDGRTFDEIVGTLASQYGVPATEIDVPVSEFLAQLLELGLIRR